MRLLAGRSYWLLLVGMTAAVAVTAVFLVARVLPEVQRGGYLASTPSPSSGAASPTGSPGLVMNGAEIPEGAACSSCHLTDKGVIGLRAIPAIAHPLDGWRQCTACHAPDRLVATAPGHSGIHASQCLFCHQPGNLPAPLSRPHRDLQNQDCLTCHGKTAPLPADMTHRSQSVCWLCHRLTDLPPPIPAHLTAPGETDCLTCHVAGKAGALPRDHAGRTGSECLLCHDVPLGSQPPSASVLIGPPMAATSRVSGLPLLPIGWPS